MNLRLSLRLLLLLLTTTAGALDAATTISGTNRFAFGANVGWINFRPDQPASPNGIVFGEYFLSGFAFGANFGWIDFGDGTPTNGIRYQNIGASDFGVNHDGAGNLSGFAFGANVGWINFGWAAPTDVNRPRVNLSTGACSGFAYSANLGWINLGTGSLTTLSMTIADTDGDGIADAWEREFFGGLGIATGTSDFDHDGSSDLSEYLAATSPLNNDDYLRIVSTTYNAAFTQATVVFNTTASRRYRLETSSGLGVLPDVWLNSPFGTFAPDAGATTSKLLSWPATDRQFIRAIALRPLP